MNKLLLSLPASLALISSASGAVILSTDFTDRTVSGDTAGNITYVTNGVTDPGDLTAIEASPGNNQLEGLFDTPDAQNFFAPILNTETQDNWSVNVSLGSPSVAISSVDLTGAMFNGSGVFQDVFRETPFVVSFVGSTSGNIGSQEIKVASAGSVGGLGGAPWNTTFDDFGGPVVLTDSETWTMVFTTNSPLDGLGNNTGISGFTVNGIPEPSSALLGGLALLGLLRRKR